ncbi:M20 family metallo-hydrolase [Sandaracinus amylolyticus]|uniref:M20 family metallo-hydrolase n=1 Tax=Sandaracinus amylolyticus TaxID=927083 RepID=UPI001F2050D1|nr:M20 family metallo-hydrolase [Sandaracinus amylolyticus]UJR87130.1 Hypothetical protein I5071_92310 [Sandaracinus amylolyticus]
MIALDLARLADEVDAQLAELATFSAAPAPAVERVLYTKTDLEGRAYVRSLAEKAGLRTRVDPIGNTFFRLEGADRGAPAIATGSHIDAIPNAGRFDGTVGVIGGIAALRAIRDAGIVPARSLEVIAFTSEEPTRFGLGCVGSRLMSGAITADRVRALRDAEGRAFEDVRRDAGFEGALEQVRLPEGCYAAFVELHVEQGPVLEAERIPIGVVTAIAAPASYALEVRGVGGHAGAVLMPARRDAMTAAAEIVLAVEHAAKSTKSPDTVGTVGVVRVHPGAINSIPSRVHLEIDLRDTDLASRQDAFAAIQDAITRVQRERGVEIAVRTINEDPPAISEPAIVDAIEASARALDLRTRRMPSRAYHDALFMARIAPTAMIFVPSVAGVSHRPDELTHPEDLAHGVAVLAGTMLRLATAEVPHG